MWEQHNLVLSEHLELFKHVKQHPSAVAFWLQDQFVATENNRICKDSVPYMRPQSSNC